MTVEPRAALDRLLAALEAHHTAAASGRGEDDPAFLSAYATLIDAFETYDEALYDAYGIDTPFLVYDEDDDGSDPDDDDEDYDDMDDLDPLMDGEVMDEEIVDEELPDDEELLDDQV